MRDLAEQVLEVHLRRSFRETEEYVDLLESANAALESEDGAYRPHDNRGRPGGLVHLRPDVPTILIPDLHGRVELLASVLLSPQWRGLEGLASGQLQIVCVGDGFHGEARAYDRWRRAYEEFLGTYKRHKAMDEEMAESLGVMEIVMRVKAAYPRLFHFLKGNHENVANEQGGGNFPFMKFVEEGAMVAYYVSRFLGEDFLASYYRFEKNFPLLAVGSRFLVSHGEPVDFFPPEDVIEYRSQAEVVMGFTWTDNDAAQDGSVGQMLDAYLPEERREGALYFGGHRPVRGLYQLRAGGEYVQFHNPDQYIAAYLDPDLTPDPDRDVQNVDVSVLTGGSSDG